MYSQNKEEEVILNYFKDFKGQLLDIGAYDGVTFSNCKALLDKGWKGVLIEPSPTVFKQLVKNMEGLDTECRNIAIGVFDGEIDFHDNHNAVASCIEGETTKWKRDGYKFNKIKVPIKTFNHIWQGRDFHFINIDTEGYDWMILQQINLDRIKCRCLCIEHNSNKVMLRRYTMYCKKYRLKEIYRSAENSIFVR